VDNAEYMVTETLDHQVRRHVEVKRELLEAARRLAFVMGASQCVEAYLGEDNEQPIHGQAMEAYESFHELAASLGLATQGEMNPAMQRMAGHVIVFPEDGPALENMVQRGITDSDTALQVLAETKEKGIPTALSDGFI
jgi:hypothetical protein